MTEHITVRLPKWPFLAADAVLLGFAALIAWKSDWSLGAWEIAGCLAAVALGGWLGVLPFVKEHHAAMRMAEANALATAVIQLKNLEGIKNQIVEASAGWQMAHDLSSKTVQTAKELADRMKAEVQDFCAFLEKANESEKAHLRLEVEKLRRAEAEWLQVLVRILDHIYAVNQAAARSGQPSLISQLSHFQHACRDAARRVGLVPFFPTRHDAFDPKSHQLEDSKPPPASNSIIIQVLATGYTYQGRLLRKALVSLSPDTQPELPLASEARKGDPPRLLSKPLEAAPSFGPSPEVLGTR